MLYSLLDDVGSKVSMYFWSSEYIGFLFWVMVRGFILFGSFVVVSRVSRVFDLGLGFLKEGSWSVRIFLILIKMKMLVILIFGCVVEKILGVFGYLVFFFSVFRE